MKQKHQYMKTVERGDKLVYQETDWILRTSLTKTIHLLVSSDTTMADKLTVNTADIKAYDSNRELM